MSLASFITQVAGLSITGVTTSYDLGAIPESLADSKLPAMIPTLPIAPGDSGQQPVILNTAGANAHEARYAVELVIYIRPVGQKPPATYVAEMATFLDNFLSAIRAADKDFAWWLTVRSPRAGILQYAGIDYVAVVIPVEYAEVL